MKCSTRSLSVFVTENNETLNGNSQNITGNYIIENHRKIDFCTDKC